VKWLSPKEFIKSSEYSILGEIDAHELEPGFLGNCNLIPTLSCLATKPEIVKQIFISQGLNACVLYSIKLFVQGVPVEILMDNLFPCYDNNNLFLTTNRNIWSLLLEKGLAKFYGKYDLHDELWP
jgi:hypothetical protein